MNTVRGSLIDTLGYPGTIANLKLTDINFAFVEGGAGLVGQAWGGISNCHVSGTINISVTDSHADDIGGLISEAAYWVGQSWPYSDPKGVIEDCTTDVAIVFSGTGRAGYVGGFVGRVQAVDFNNCHSTGNISHTGWTPVSNPYSWYWGGFAGHMRDNANEFNDLLAVTNCSATGNVILPLGPKVDYVGGFMGNAYAESSITFTMCYATGDIQCEGTAGGFIGYPETGYPGVIEFNQCYATGDITLKSGFNDSGGFTGYAQWDQTFIDCYARGSAAYGSFVAYTYCDNNTSFTNCYGTGAVTDAGGGGFCGYNSRYGSPVYNDCFWDTQTTGKSTTVGDAEGHTTEWMKTESNFTNAGWDFNAVWDIDGSTNDGYPFFQWSIAPGATWIPKVIFI